MHLLTEWESFYVIVGSSGGALIGLQFVVMTLIADRQSLAGSDAVGAFGTPTVVHFTNALVVSAVMSAPWATVLPLTVALAMCGGGGLAYSAIAIRRARRQHDYEPVMEDWLWYAIAPCSLYGLLTVTGLLLTRDIHIGLFWVAGATLGLLLNGIHNAWDAVTHIVITGAHSSPPSGDAR